MADADLTVVTPEEAYLEHAGERLGLRVYDRGDREGLPVLVFWPAMGVPARYYERFCQHLAGEGFPVVVADLRGHGASTPPVSRRSRYGYADLVGRDCDAVLDWVGERYPDQRVALGGHSLGGQLSLLYAAAHGADRVAGVALVAAGIPYYRCYRGVGAVGVLAFTQLAAVVASLWGYWPGHRLGFGGVQARGVIRDWARTARTGTYRIPGAAEDYEARLALMRTPVLAVSVAGDTLTPPATIDHLCEKLTAAPVERWHYTAERAGTRLDHFRWVKAGAPVAARIRAWAEQLPG
ncbi:Alpha/beta hydrolase fold [Carbonactinospora thermoautotrophica]|uniref:Alpha/beta hydrolase fold n=1 Tax=Carbonactinospora thermoautotrophica TaxID=1469144 RepID=A0A132MVQ4_9ACTN|nr:alpha/beta fold hydrolase [Carbonactinospora thermoautotrophica]KWX01939.1 Alpha/beta hydrolase fold [Carbonactinospora thermoautotrophica]